MMNSIQDLQDQLQRTDNKLTQEILNVTQDHENFKNEMRTQVMLLSQSTSPSSSSTNASVPVSSPAPVMSMSNVSQAVTSSVPVQLSVMPPSANDLQVQMMQMLSDTFSKLTVALEGKTSDSKSEWPKFQGEPKKFRGWYLAILA